MKVRRLLKEITERSFSDLAPQTSWNQQLLTDFRHNFLIISRMLQTANTKRKDPAAIWTDVNKRVLIDALIHHSGGRYANLANAKGKWNLVVSDFQSATGQIQFPNPQLPLLLKSLRHLRITRRVVVLEECADDPDYCTEEEPGDLPSICLPEWLWCWLQGSCYGSTKCVECILRCPQWLIAICERTASILWRTSGPVWT